MCNEGPDSKWGWRDTPRFDRLSTRGRRDTNESEVVILQSMGGEKIPADNRDGMEFRECFPWQLANALHCPPRIRPLMHVLLARSLTLNKIVRSTEVFGQASREELVSILKDRRIAEDILKASTDLGHTSTKSKPGTELDTTPVPLPP